MKDVLVGSWELERLVFTDPLTLILEAEEAIVDRYERGMLKPPYVIEDGDEYLIFNGINRTLVAKLRGWDLKVRVIEDDEDIVEAQRRDSIFWEFEEAMTYAAVRDALQENASRNRHQSVEGYRR